MHKTLFFFLYSSADFNKEFLKFVDALNYDLILFLKKDCAHNLKQPIWNYLEIYVIDIDIHFNLLLQCSLQTSTCTSMQKGLKLGTKKLSL
jgi:hypothetical protein